MVYLALRHLLSRKKQSIVTLLGIMIGTTAFIVMSSFFNGLQNQITDSLVSGDAHIKIYAYEEDVTSDTVRAKVFKPNEYIDWIRVPAGRKQYSSIENPGMWNRIFENTPGYLASTPVYSTKAFIKQNNQTWNFTLVGMVPSEQVKITNIESKMTRGSLVDLEKTTSGVIIGEALAKAMGKEFHDEMVVTSNNGKKFPLKIVGLYNTNNRRADMGSGLVLLTDAQKIGEELGVISQIHVKVENFREAATIATGWAKMSNDLVESWDQANEGLISMFESQDTTRYMATGIIMLVASFGIYNILNMIVQQKRKDIAILRSMGFEGKDIVKLFLLQGLALGVLGGVLGMLLGYGICEMIGTIEFGPPGTRGKGNGFTLDATFQIYATAFIISNSAALLASFLPSYGASKLTPIEIIRSGVD